MKDNIYVNCGETWRLLFALNVEFEPITILVQRSNRQLMSYQANWELVAS